MAFASFNFNCVRCSKSAPQDVSVWDIAWRPCSIHVGFMGFWHDLLRLHREHCQRTPSLLCPIFSLPSLINLHIGLHILYCFALWSFFFVLHYIKLIFKFILRGNHQCSTSSRMLFRLPSSVEFGIIVTLMCSFSEVFISLLHLFSYFAPIIVETFQLFILHFASFRRLLMTLYCEQ